MIECSVGIGMWKAIPIPTCESINTTRNGCKAVGTELLQTQKVGTKQPRIRNQIIKWNLHVMKHNSVIKHY